MVEGSGVTLPQHTDWLDNTKQQCRERLANPESTRVLPQREGVYLDEQKHYGNGQTAASEANADEEYPHAAGASVSRRHQRQPRQQATEIERGVRGVNTETLDVSTSQRKTILTTGKCISNAVTIVLH